MEYGRCVKRGMSDHFWTLVQIILNNAPNKFYSVRPVQVLLQTITALALLLCFAYESKLLDCLIKRVQITPFTSINGIAELLESTQYRLITSGEPEVSNWFTSLRTSTLEGIRRLDKALKQNPPIIVQTFDEGLNELLPYSRRVFHRRVHTYVTRSIHVVVSGNP